MILMERVRGRVQETVKRKGKETKNKLIFLMRAEGAKIEIT